MMNATTTRTLLASCCRRSNMIGTSASTAVSKRYLSSHGQEAVGRLKDALEQYRVQNYSQEIPSRFKKEIVFQCNSLMSLSASASSTTTTTATTIPNKNDEQMIAVQGIEQLLQNIGISGKQVTRDDVETIVSEIGGTGGTTTTRADKILMELL